MPKKISKGDPVDASGDRIQRLLRALAHPLRLRVLEALMEEPASATTLSKWFDMPLGNVAYHLCEVLAQQCEIVTVVERHKRRGALEKVYAIKPDSYVNVIKWPITPEPLRSGLRGLSLASFLRITIAALEAEAAEPRDDSMYAWRSAQVNGQGQHEIREAIKALTEKIKAVEDSCATLNPSSLFPLVVGVAAFETASRPRGKAR